MDLLFQIPILNNQGEAVEVEDVDVAEAEAEAAAEAEAVEEAVGVPVVDTKPKS